MKKLLAMVTAMVMIISLATTVSANEIATYTWNRVRNNNVSGITVTSLDGGFRLNSKPNDRWTDIHLTVSGDVFKIIEYSSTRTETFQTRDLKRGETVTIRLFEATLWSQDELPVDYDWSQVRNNGISGITVTSLDRGFTLRSEGNSALKDINLTVSGDMFGIIQYSSSQTTSFQTVTLKRGEAKTIRLFEATLWLQEQPLSATAIAFNTGNLRRADANGYGWIFEPGEPISFVVPNNQGIKEIQAHDSRDGQNRTFKPGQTAYVGYDGASIWFEASRAKEDGETRYSFKPTASAVLLGDVNGDGEIGIFDALQILMYLVNMESSILMGKNACPKAIAAARIYEPSSEQITIQDALHVLMYCANMIDSSKAGGVVLVE